MPKKNGRDRYDLSRLDKPYLVLGLKAAVAFVAKSTTTATSAWGLWSGFVDGQRAATIFGRVQRVNSGRGFFL